MSPAAGTPVVRARKLSPALFAAIVICFLLPFVTVACDSAGSPRQVLTTMSGLEVVAGKSVDMSQYGSSTKPGHIDGEPWALVALLAAVIGIGIAFLPGRTGALGGAAAGAVAFVGLLLAKVSIDNRIANPANLTSTANGTTSTIPTGMRIVTDYQIGYWLALVLSAAAVALFIYLLVVGPKQAAVAPPAYPYPPPQPAPTPPPIVYSPPAASDYPSVPATPQAPPISPQPPPAPAAGRRVFCPKCGQMLNAQTGACGNCGWQGP